MAIVPNPYKTTGFLGWIDDRFPLTKIWKDHISEYYAPKNFNWWYTYGSLALLVLVNQLLTGIWLTMHYKPDEAAAFDSIEYIMRDVPGGWQEYSGLMFGRTLKLVRRDFGLENLKRSNFPEPLARKLEGDVFAELKLSLVQNGTELTGSFTPQKIDFLLAPPRITGRRWMPPVARTYCRVVPVELPGPEAARLQEDKGIS
jgi:hypothetical protein